MAIVSYQISQAGMSGSFPQFVYIITNDAMDEVVAPGYLNAIVSQGAALSTQQCAVVYTKTSVVDRGQTEIFSIVHETNGDWSLVAFGGSASVTNIPTIVSSIGTEYSNVADALDAGNNYILVIACSEERNVTTHSVNTIIEILDSWDLNDFNITIPFSTYGLTLRGIGSTSQVQIAYTTSKAIIAGTSSINNHINVENILFINNASTAANTPLCSSTSVQTVYNSTWFSSGQPGGGFRSQSSFDEFSNIVLWAGSSSVYDLMRVGEGFASDVTLRGGFSNAAGQYAVNIAQGGAIDGLFQTDLGGEYASVLNHGVIDTASGTVASSDLIIEVDGAGSAIANAHFCQIFTGSDSVINNCSCSITMTSLGSNNIITGVKHSGAFTLLGTLNIISNLCTPTGDNFTIGGTNNIITGCRAGTAGAGVAHFHVTACTAGVLSGCMAESNTVVDPGQSITSTGFALLI